MTRNQLKYCSGFLKGRATSKRGILTRSTTPRASNRADVDEKFHGCSIARWLMVACSFVIVIAHAQDPRRFNAEVDKLVARDSSMSKQNLVLFTGSSSIRMWKTLRQDFPTYNVVNTGFGGSETSDLIFFADRLIIPYSPKKIVIYEGDNDLNSGKKPSIVMRDIKQLLSTIQRHLPADTEVFFLTAKPSPSRWKLKRNYEKFNRRLKRWVKHQDNTGAIDVWTPMLTGDGKLRPDLYIEDNLHMNANGYAIWRSVIAPYLAP